MTIARALSRSGARRVCWVGRRLVSCWLSFSCARGARSRQGSARASDSKYPGRTGKSVIFQDTRSFSELVLRTRRHSAKTCLRCTRARLSRKRDTRAPHIAHNRRAVLSALCHTVSCRHASPAAQSCAAAPPRTAKQDGASNSLLRIALWAARASRALTWSAGASSCAL